MERLFVYGSLRRGQSAHHLMAGARFLGDATIRGAVVQHGQYPGLIPGDEQIAGELFEIPAELFERLDEYEGPDYHVGQTSVRQGGEESLSAWVYWLT